MNHSQAFYKEHFSGTLSNKIKDVMSGVPDIIRALVGNISHQFFAILFAVLMLCQVQPTYGILMTVWVFIFLTGSLFLSKKAKLLSERTSNIRSTVVGRFVDIFSNSLTVRLFHSQNFETKGLKKLLRLYMNADQKRDCYMMKVYAFQELSFLIYQTLCLIWLVFDFKRNLVTAGDFVLIFNINLGIISSLWGVSRVISKIAENLGIVKQGLDLVLKSFDIQDAPNATELWVTKGRIEFQDVDFFYQEGASLFSGKSIAIEGGQKVGLVGYSGGGKTTFVNLILRLYDVSRGRLLIDGQDIKTVTQESLHKNIAMIPQDPTLFHRTIKENIAYGVETISDDTLITACKVCHLYDFIKALPEGFDSLVGERGVKLSGGQRQRVAIARAFLKASRILILDEATSQLDSLTEGHIQESLEVLMQNKTSLVIAHRLSTLLKMDRILVFDSGNIVQDGSHKDLLNKKGVYQKLWNKQVGSLLGNFVESV